MILAAKILLFFRFADVLHHLRIQVEDQFFCNVGAMVAEAFHLADDARHVKAGKCAARMRFDLLGDQRSRIVIDLIDDVVFQENA